MLRRFFRSFASWAGIALAEGQSTETRQPARLEFSTHGPLSNGRARAEEMWERLRSAKVTYGRATNRRGVAGFAMDAADCNTSSAFGDLDEGQTVTNAQLGWFASQAFIGYQMAAVLMQHWLIAKACSMPARDAIRNWMDLSLSGDDLGEEEDERRAEILEAVAAADKEFGLQGAAEEFIRMGRGFGIRLALFRVDLGSEKANQDYYENPFNPDAVKPGTYRGIRQIDQYWCSPILDSVSGSDPASPKFYEPEWWMIGGQRYHKSHFAIFRNGTLPDNLKPYYLFGGIPLPQMIMERVYGAERSANEGPLLLLTKRKIVWKTNLQDAMGDPDKFLHHVRSVSDLANSFAMQAIDEGDDVVVHDTALADVDTVIMGQFQLVAATANVPATKLLGTTPKGFNSTGEAEAKNYGQELETIQKNDLTPFVERHHLMVMRSEIAEEFGLNAEEVTIDHAWEPTDSPSAKELAEINKMNADTDNVFLTAGVVDPEEVRERLRNDNNSGYTGLAAVTDDDDDDEDEAPPEGETSPADEEAGAVGRQPPAE